MPKSPGRAKSAPQTLPGQRAAKATDDLAHARALHGRALPGVIYGLVLAPMVGEKGRAEAGVYARDVIASMAPRDAAEEMLIAQLLFAHARAMRLTELANQQTAIDSVRVVHEYADRASNTYRRLMLALAEYRRPPVPASSFTAIRQANIAGQQVVQNHENSVPQNATNEQGCPSGESGRPAVGDAAELPAHAGGLGVPPFVRSEAQAVGTVHGAPDALGQSRDATERPQARPAVGRGGSPPQRSL